MAAEQLSACPSLRVTATALARCALRPLASPAGKWYGEDRYCDQQTIYGWSCASWGPDGVDAVRRRAQRLGGCSARGWLGLHAARIHQSVASRAHRLTHRHAAAACPLPPAPHSAARAKTRGPIRRPAGAHHQGLGRLSTHLWGRRVAQRERTPRSPCKLNSCSRPVICARARRNWLPWGDCSRVKTQYRPACCDNKPCEPLHGLLAPAGCLCAACLPAVTRRLLVKVRCLPACQPTSS